MQLQTTQAERYQAKQEYITYMRKRQQQFDREAKVFGIVLAVTGFAMLALTASVTLFK